MSRRTKFCSNRTSTYAWGVRNNLPRSSRKASLVIISLDTRCIAWLLSAKTLLTSLSSTFQTVDKVWFFRLWSWAFFFWNMLPCYLTRFRPLLLHLSRNSSGHLLASSRCLLNLSMHASFYDEWDFSKLGWTLLKSSTTRALVSTSLQPCWRLPAEQSHSAEAVGASEWMHNRSLRGKGVSNDSRSLNLR